MTKRSVGTVLVLSALVGLVFWLSGRQEQVAQGVEVPAPEGAHAATFGRSEASIGPVGHEAERAAPAPRPAEAAPAATVPAPGPATEEPPAAVDVRLVPPRRDAGVNGPLDPGPSGSASLDSDYGRAFEEIDPEHAERMIAVRRERAVLLVNDLVRRMDEQAEVARAAGDTEGEDAFLQRKRRLLWRRSVLEGQLNQAAELANQDYAPGDAPEDR